MKPMSYLITLVLTVLLAGVSASYGDTVVTGRKGENGAHYLIVVPDAWNGDLVIWNHGLSHDAIEPLSFADLGPLALIQLSEGYAVAASSYQQIGWALFKTKNDLQKLVNVFKKKVGHPTQVWVTGGSLGGIVTAQAVEQANIGNVTGHPEASFSTRQFPGIFLLTNYRRNDYDELIRGY